MDAATRGGTDWALQAKAITDRVQNALGECSGRYIGAMQATAEAMGGALGVDRHVLDIFSEEIVRGTAAAPLSQMLRALDPVLREMAHMGAWNVISPVEASGVVEVVDDLKDIQTKTYAVPTILVSRRVGGEEDIPRGVVGVVTPDMPDILSHVSVRARNEGCLFATVFDGEAHGDGAARRPGGQVRALALGGRLADRARGGRRRQPRRAPPPGPTPDRRSAAR